MKALKQLAFRKKILASPQEKEAIDVPLSLTKNLKKYCVIEIQGSVAYFFIGKTADLSKATLYTLSFSSEVLDEGYVKDELAFFETLEGFVQAHQLKKWDVYTFAADKSVLYRVLELPEEVADEEVYDYVALELNHTIHLPFDESYFDIHIQQPSGVKTLYATPADTAMNYMMQLEDAKLNPVVLDVRSLSVIRALTYLQLIDEQQVYLVSEWQTDALILTIYSSQGVEFLRYHSLEYDKNKVDLRYDELNDNYTIEGDSQEFEQAVLEALFEVRQILGFYEFSIHRGAARIEQFILFGNHPLLSWIEGQVHNDFDIPTMRVSDSTVKAVFPQLGQHLLATLGIFLREEQ